MDHTGFETARIVGARALQISVGAPPLLDCEDESDSYALADLEFKRGILSMTVARS